MTGVAWACVLRGGPILEIVARGRIYRFEMNQFAGPNVVGKNGDPLSVQPVERSPFWHAVTQWARQGRPQEIGTRRCVWYENPRPIVVALTPRHQLVIGEEPAERGT